MGSVMKKIGIIVIFLLIVLFSSSFGKNSVYSQTETPSPSPSPSPTPTLDSSSQDRLKQIQDQITEIENKIVVLQGQEKTLSSQIAVMDSQIKLTEYRIEATQEQITSLILDIDTTTKKISGLQQSLNSLVGVLANRIVATYEVGTIQPFQVLLTSNNASDFFKRLNYLKIAQAHDKKLVYDTQQAKVDYANQKVIFEDKKKKVELLKKELETYTAQLDKDKANKQELLAITKNNEERFQQEVSRLKADRDAILFAISNVGTKIGDVNKGDVIAIQGNTGCVFPPPPGGNHLHFEVYKDAKVQGGAVVDINTGQNIQFKFSEHLVNPHTYLDNGQWAKPISVYPNNITTEFGENSVFGTPHTGLDIAGPIGSPIYAVDKGIAYAAAGPVCDSQMGYKPGTTYPARGRIVDHQNGIVTLYWHTSN